MKQLVILSGKGGTGKTSVAAAFAHLLSLKNTPFKTVFADADVDASNLELVLSPSVLRDDQLQKLIRIIVQPVAFARRCADLMR